MEAQIVLLQRLARSDLNKTIDVKSARINYQIHDSSR